MTKKGPTKSTPKAKARGIRIIGGSHRGSVLRVLDRPGLRPTPDRIRETLFNWLQFEIAGKRCLDLFAGTGALGIEALSRGASAVQFVETDRDSMKHLLGNLARLKMAHGKVDHVEAGQFLTQTPEPFDLVFVDPPFALNQWSATAFALESKAWLLPKAWIYMEMPVNATPDLPGNWSLQRHARAGEVAAKLYRREAVIG